MPKTKQPMWARREYAYKRAMKDSTMDTDEGIRRRYRVITGDPKPDPKPPVSSQKHPADGKAFDRKKGVYVDTALAEVRRDYHRKLS